MCGRFVNGFVYFCGLVYVFTRFFFFFATSKLSPSRTFYRISKGKSLIRWQNSAWGGNRKILKDTIQGISE